MTNSLDDPFDLAPAIPLEIITLFCVLVFLVALVRVKDVDPDERQLAFFLCTCSALLLCGCIYLSFLGGG